MAKDHGNGKWWWACCVLDLGKILLFWNAYVDVLGCSGLHEKRILYNLKFLRSTYQTQNKVLHFGTLTSDLLLHAHHGKISNKRER